MDVARCDRCQVISVLEYMAHIEYEDPGMPREGARRQSARVAGRFCPQCSALLTKHLSRFFDRRVMPITRAWPAEV